ncbi:MAG: glutaredoxin [Selenomonadaceae bacterium]|nr:glutaredoxin [Selenomonadaceae bacterium]
MKKIVCFYLEDCPYCHKAKRAFQELTTDSHQWSKVPIEWVEESRERPTELKNFNYYYVPTIYVGEDKVYEASPSDDYNTIKSNVLKALEQSSI